MDESQLLIALVGILDAGFSAYTGNPLNTRPLPTGITAARAFQPTQQGVTETATVYVNFERKKMIGFPKRYTKRPNVPDDPYIHAEGQRYESTYHIEALVPQSPAGFTAMTEADVLNIARLVLTNDNAVVALAAQNVGLLRVTEILSNYIVDDKGQNENVPFFEITFSHRLELSVTVPTIDEFAEVFARI